VSGVGGGGGGSGRGRGREGEGRGEWVSGRAGRVHGKTGFLGGWGECGVCERWYGRVLLGPGARAHRTGPSVLPRRIAECCGYRAEHLCSASVDALDPQLLHLMKINGCPRHPEPNESELNPHHA